MRGRLKVVKSDGTVEVYLHTKVVGTLSLALECVDTPDIYVAEELADVVTYYLYNNTRLCASTSEIFSMIKVVLVSTGYDEAAAGLSEHHCRRRLKRFRTEVVLIDVCELADAERLCSAQEHSQKSRWDKGRIVGDLVAKHSISRPTARTIASMVEEKIFGMDISVVTTSLIKQLVYSDTASVLRAQEQLQTI